MTSERQQEALELRMRGMSQRAIGDAMGISQQAVAYHLKNALLEYQKDIEKNAAKIRAIELSRLERLQAAVWQPALDGNLEAVDKAIKVMDRRAKLVGLDAPKKTELTGKDGGPLAVASISVDLSKLSDAQLDRYGEIARAYEDLMAEIASPAAGETKMIEARIVDEEA